jgi:hypothetical protein
MLVPDFVLNHPLHIPPVEQAPPKISLAVKLSKYTARNPRKVLIGSLVTATFFSFIGLYVGGFKIEVDNKGWLSRKTLVANRQMQNDLVNMNRIDLFDDEDGSVWSMLQKENSQQGYVDILEKDESYQKDDQSRRTRNLLHSAVDVKRNMMESLKSFEYFSRTSLAQSCDGSTSWYQDYKAIVQSNNLFAMWKAMPQEETSSISLLEEEMMNKICDSELNTLKVLEDSNLCDKCGSDGTCLKPFSLVYLLREKLDMIDSSCDELMSGYATQYQSEFTNDLLVCTREYITNFDRASLLPGPSVDCQLPSYNPILVDLTFGNGNNTNLRYSSTFFRISQQKEVDAALYDAYASFDFADGEKLGATYDTSKESLQEFKVDLIVQSDMVSAYFL